MALSWLDGLLFGVRRVYYEVASVLTEAPERPAIKVLGDVTVTDDPVNKMTVLIFNGNGTASVAVTSPLENTGTATDPVIEMTGSVTDIQHGSRGGGTLHAVAVASGAAGFLSGADKAKLDGIEAGAQAVTFTRVAAALAAATTSVSLNGQAFGACTGLANATGEVLIAAGDGTAEMSGTVSARLSAGTTMLSVETGAVVTDGPSGVEEHRNTGTLICTQSYALAGSFEIFAADVVQIASACTQSTTGTGTSRSIQAGQGKAGFSGGDAEIRAGDGGTPGTDLPGNFNVRLGTAVSNVTGKQIWRNGAGGVLGQIGQVAGPTLQIENGAITNAGLTLLTTSGTIAVNAATSLALTASSGPVECTSSTSVFNYYGASAALARADTMTPAGAHTIVHQSSTTSVTDSIAKRAGTGANAGASRTISAQDGQDVAGGTNNDGGDLTLVAGAIGAGGVNGSNGSVLIKTGSITRTQIAGTGAQTHVIDALKWRITQWGDGSGLTLETASNLTTTSGTPTATLQIYTWPSSVSATVTIEGSASDIITGDTNAYCRKYKVNQLGGGGVTIRTVAEVVPPDEDDATWDLIAQDNGGVLEVVFTGDATNQCEGRVKITIEMRSF